MQKDMHRYSANEDKCLDTKYVVSFILQDLTGLNRDILIKAKQLGFSDKQIAKAVER